VAKRLLTSTPKELLAMNSDELLNAIKMSEGRVLAVASRVRCANLVDYASNAEVAAAFGADIIILDTYAPSSPYIPGWPSKVPVDDEPTKDVQIQMGRGYSLREIREIVGRPVSILLLIHTEENKASMISHYGNILATRENAHLALESGADMIMVSGWAPKEKLEKIMIEMREETRGRAILEYARPHGPGLIGEVDQELGPQSLITDEEIRILLDIGVDVIGLPVPGTYPGFTIPYVSRLVEMIHNGGALASLGLHTSQEGADVDTIKRLALNAKFAGADIHELGDSGFNEMLIEPQNIMAYSIAIRGRRHTYRRMAISSLR
jgi:hypothetical protein